jgi:hypothetical protein
VSLSGVPGDNLPWPDTDWPAVVPGYDCVPAQYEEELIDGGRVSPDAPLWSKRDEAAVRGSGNWRKGKVPASEVRDRPTVDVLELYHSHDHGA